MKQHILLCLTLLWFFISAYSAVVLAEEGDDQKESRIDFGNTYIQGQSIKSGAVYLTNRRKTPLKTLLKTRKSYRQEIVNDFYGHEMELEDQAAEPKPLPDLKLSK
jgi:hypothetical protein